MTDDEVERKARAEYEATLKPGSPLMPWDELPEYRRTLWRDAVGQGLSWPQGS